LLLHEPPASVAEDLVRAMPRQCLVMVMRNLEFVNHTVFRIW
jgi:hypothetical protein